SVSSYQAIVLPQEYDYDIRVIESVNASGNTLQMQTSQGNMCDLFRNISFTLSTDPSASTRSSDGSPIYTPVSYGTIDADGHYTELYRREGHTRAYFQNGDTLWSFHTDFDDEDILSGAAGRLYWEKCSFDAGLQGEFFFNFGEKQITEVRRKGDIKRFSYRLTGGVEVDMKLHYRYEYEYREENDEIMKENIFPTRTFKFMVGNVPVFLNVDTHLGGYTLFESEGRADATVGVKMGNEVSMGVEWTPESGAQPLGPDVTPSFEVYPPTFEAEASAEAKVSYYPRIEIELYKFFGPWAEPRPYIKSSVEAGTRLSADGNNHVGWQAQTHNGMDLRLGLGLDIFGWQTDLYESPLFNPVKDRLLFDAPSRIRCLSPENNVEVKKGEKVKAEFIVESFCSITHEYYPCPFALVNFEAESGDLSSEFAVADAEGKVSVEWTPSPKESASTRATEMKNCNLTARIVDKAGEALDEATLTVKTEKPTLCPDGNHPHAIDLGTGVKWSCCNVGAYSPEEYGDYYAWGETEEKSNYSLLTYQYYLDDLDGDTEFANIGFDIGGTQYDAARAHWGGSWRMPTWSESRELVIKCSWKWITQNGVNGQLVTGPNGNSIFLPAAGDRYGTGLNYRGSVGLYWSASLNGRSRGLGAFSLYFYDGYDNWNNWSYRFYGRTVRPVTDELLSDSEK
ncbi:MAG: hypothetical protein IJ417_00150, partial [Bacteroidaceae bacterium]|nr:hypothetical protein [Bacteroidaceae bacterium]